MRWYFDQVGAHAHPGQIIRGKGKYHFSDRDRRKIVFTLTSWSRSESPWLREAGISEP